MKSDILELYGKKINVYSLNTVIVGTGAAGYNAADRLYSFGQKDIAIVTESINSGTSRNTGSDKQTYYLRPLETRLILYMKWQRHCLMVEVWMVILP